MIAVIIVVAVVVVVVVVVVVRILLFVVLQFFRLIHFCLLLKNFNRLFLYSRIRSTIVSSYV